MDRARIRAAVDAAFSAFSELSETGVLEEETVTGFDFTTGDVDSSAGTVAVTVIPTETVHENDSSVLYRYVARSEDLDSTVNYAAITIGSTRYTVAKATIYEGVALLELTGGDA